MPLSIYVGSLIYHLLRVCCMSGIGPSTEDTKNRYEMVLTLEAALAVVGEKATETNLCSTWSICV